MTKATQFFLLMNAVEVMINVKNRYTKAIMIIIPNSFVPLAAAVLYIPERAYHVKIVT